MANIYSINGFEIYASTASLATTASFASTASFATTASFASTASFATTASYATQALSASYAPGGGGDGGTNLGLVYAISLGYIMP